MSDSMHCVAGRNLVPRTTAADIHQPDVEAIMAVTFLNAALLMAPKSTGPDAFKGHSGKLLSQLRSWQARWYD